MEEPKAQPPQQSPLTKEFREIDEQYRRDLTIALAGPKVRTAGRVASMAVIGVLVAIWVASVPRYIVDGAFADRAMIGTLSNNIASLHAANAAHAPEPLRIGATELLTVGANGAADLLTEGVNLNEEWWASFSFHYGEGEDATPVQEGFALPNAPFYATAFGQQGGQAGEFVIENIRWHRVSPREIADVSQWMMEHDGFTVDNAVVEPPIIYEHGRIGRVALTLTNSTPYSYWDASFLVLLRNGGNTMGVASLSVPNFRSGEQRDLALHVPGDITQRMTVEVIPQISYFSPAVYLDPEGEIAPDLRDTLEERRR